MINKSTAKKVKYFFLNNILTYIIFIVLKIYAKTLRVQFEGIDKIQKHLEQGGRIIFPSWHQRLFGGFFVPTLFDWSPCIMISQSRDGDFISKIVSYIGWIPVRGSSSRGGAKALRDLVPKIAKNRIGVHIVDGPNGPAHIIKPGLITLARNTDAPICPGFIAYEKYWMANSWDRFLIPKPFSRVLVRFGDIFHLPETTSDDQFEAFRQSMEDHLIEGYAKADKYWEK